MTFLNTAAFFFLLAVPLLVLLYFLKLKRPEHRVPSTLIWRKVIEDMRVNAPFQRLRRSLLLLLQLLALLAAVAALARPLMRVRDDTRQSLVVLLDISASMAAAGPDGRTRLDRAKADIAALAERLSKGDEMMLITFHRRASVVSGFAADARTLKNALRAVRPTDTPTDVQQALALARSVANTRTHPRVLLFSDGAFTPPAGVDLPVPVEVRAVGEPVPNVAITGLDIRRSLDDRRRIEMFVAVENVSEAPTAGTMTVRLDDRILDSKGFSVGPRETLSQIFEAVLTTGGTITVSLDTDDALACDNHAFRVIDPLTEYRLLVVGENTFFLERALRAAPGVSVQRVAPAAYTAADAAACFAVIWNAVPAPGIAPGFNLYLGCAPELEGLHAGPVVEAPGVLDWDAGHPVNRFLDFDNLIVAKTLALDLPDSATVLLRGTTTPLIALLEQPQALLGIVGFDPLDSNWPLLVSFPLFLQNALVTVDEQRARGLARNVPVGRVLTAAAGGPAPRVRLPDGTTRAMQQAASGDWTFSDTDRCGLYVLRPGEPGAVPVAVNLFDRNESSLAVVETPDLGQTTVTPMQPRKRVNREFWKPLLMAVAALLVIEWIVYHRRVFV